MTRRHIQRLRYFGLLAAIVPVTAAGVITAPAMAASQVGVAAAVNTSAFGTAPGLSRKTKVLGDNVIYRERIETTGSGLVQVLLVDGSTFTVGPNSDLVIDEFVYDPNTGQGKLVASLGKGVARFVGGKLSKNKAGVNVNTPVGTIGIRGGIANMDLTSGGGVFSLLFGEELTFTGRNGETNRVYEAGYTLQVSGGGASSEVRRTTQADLGGVQQGLSGKPGQSGGATQKPTEASVTDSGFTQANSDLGVTNTLPAPKPEVVQSTEVTETDETLVQIQETTQDETVEEITEENPQPEPEPEVVTVQVRILKAGDTFTPSWNPSIVVNNPGAQGILGGSDGINENVIFTGGEIYSGSATELFYAQVDGNPLFQFIYGEEPSLFFYSQTYLNDDEDVIQQNGAVTVPAASVDFDPSYGEISGFGRGVQVSNEDFVAFAHFPAVSFDTNGPVYDPDGANMILGLYGVGTDWSQFNKTEAQVREYSLSSDPLTTFVMGTETGDGGLIPLETDALFMNPLVAQLMGTSFMEEIETTELLMIQRDPSTLRNSQVLASSFLIQGTGSSQKSFISLAVGNIFDDNGTLTYDTGRRGSHRMDASQSGAHYGGAIQTISGPDGSNFFGSDAQSFLIGGAVDNEDPYGEGYILRPNTLDQTDTLSMSFHVGVLDHETPVSSFERTQRTLAGFATGVFESGTNVVGGVLQPKLFASSSVDDLTLTFLPDANTLTAEVKVEDVLNADSELDSYHFGFGRNTNGGDSGRGTFIDNDTYAAREQRDTSAAYVVTDNNVTVTQPEGDNPNSYLIPDTLLPGADADIFAGVNRCTCAFLEWGYWGASVQLNGSDAQANLTNGERYDNMHLGTWVAGNATQSADLPSTGTATYAGHAVGSVVNNGAQYLAAGNFGMEVNFSTRNATAAVTNFDGRNFGASMAEVTTESGANLFSGSITGAGETMQGQFNASVVTGPDSVMDGVMGNFTATDGAGWSATGITAGALQ
ncbi:FecR domain-containing protein [Roseibium litorale]|uniref:FecR domain-containing protein n=1 Tax=Roseibium litorale TaxID=2803841 RepID=A0ABR9CW98_9HYPH|nr:FecR domain-containing protein [Roseibium litorale]MBD8894327.1 FecR domain-containing protein [Roseibium litorale]